MHHTGILIEDNRLSCGKYEAVFDKGGINPCWKVQPDGGGKVIGLYSTQFLAYAALKKLVDDDRRRELRNG